jgi:hypothetical protein
MAAITEKYAVGAQFTLLSTELNALTNNGLALSPAFSNLQGGGAGDGYTFCDVELIVTFTGAPTLYTGCSLWFVGSQDGINYEDGNTTTTPARRPDLVFSLRSVTTAQRILIRSWLPWGLVKALLKNDGTNAAMAATGNTLRIRSVARQGV